MKRRTFIKALAASGGLAGGFGGAALTQGRRKPTITVITDIMPGTPVSRLRAMLGALLAKGLPVSCIVRTSAPNGDRLRADSPLAALLREFMAKAPGVLEIVGYVPDLADQTAFFQARAAYRARKDLIEALVTDPAGTTPGPLLQSLACEHSDKPLSPEGVRSAGIRNVLVLPKTSDSVSSENWDNGVLRLFGGVRADLFAALDHLGRLSPAQFQNVILLSVANNTQKSENVIAAAATVFANVALRHESDQWISNLRLCELQLRDAYFSFKRRVGLHLFEPPEGALNLAAGFAAFKSDLVAARMEFSVGTELPVRPGEVPRDGVWVATESDTLQNRSGLKETVVRLACSDAPRPVSPDRSIFLDAGVGVALNPHAGGQQGLDECGRLHVPVVLASLPGALQSRFLVGADNTNDLIVAVPPEILATQAQRNALLGELKRLKSDWVTQFVPIADLVRPIAPKGHLIAFYRHTEASIPKIQPRPAVLTGQERQRLLEDAVTAWSYFYRLTDKRTGLCPATVFYSGGSKSALKSATMWDIGSHINALMAAVDLGLIDEREFRRNTSKILASIKGRKSNGRTLPSEWIRTNKVRSGNSNFDGCDAGRLLASLHNLSRHRYSDDGAADLIRSWDLDKVVVDGKIFSVIDGELKSTYKSHCAHYAALAFRAWGVDVASPYEVLAGRPACEGKMALLDVAAKIGPIGAEPLLLEALDFGLSPESEYLAQVLFAAQLREFEATRQLVCVSEGPIDRSPWFLYQGLQFDAPDRTWVIDTVRDNEEFKTEAFRRENRVLSPKAAFLWSAKYPHSFSDRLLAYVRDKAKTTIGFASGIYSKTGKPTANYSDINTNGIILQSIAAILAENPRAG